MRLPNLPGGWVNDNQQVSDPPREARRMRGVCYLYGKEGEVADPTWKGPHISILCALKMEAKVEYPKIMKMDLGSPFTSHNTENIGKRQPRGLSSSRCLRVAIEDQTTHIYLRAIKASTI